MWIVTLAHWLDIQQPTTQHIPDLLRSDAVADLALRKDINLHHKLQG